MHALVQAVCGPGLSVLETAAVSTVALVALSLLLQFAIELHASAASYKRTAPQPTVSRARMLAHDVAGWLGYSAPACLWDAWAQPSWSLGAPGLLATTYWSMAVLVWTDTCFYFFHRWCHTDRRAYRLLHAKHHEPTASLNAATTGYNNPVCAALEFGAPVALAWAVTASVTGSLWHAIASHVMVVVLGIYGHTGIDLAFDSPQDLVAVLICPLLVPYALLPNHHAPHDHQHHHSNPRANFAPFFTWLDDFFQTVPDGARRLPCSLLVMVMALGYQAAVLVTLQLLVSWPAQTVAAYALAYLLVPVELAAAVSGALRIPELVRYSFGWLQDAYRRHLAISYSAPGTLGVFTPVESSSGKPATYVFACHPTGVLSRGALLTFAARGWRSPVSGLARVRLAVGDVLFQLPIAFSREFLLAIGCVPAGKDSLRRQLQAGTSIAITPGGFREPTFTGSYKVLLRKRRGFIALALDTGAHLVPLTPELVQVVFGQPLAPKAGEGVEQLHQRYTASLQSLAADHGVKLELL